MRGDDNQQEGMFSYISPEKRVPADHPLRPIRKIVDEILKEMSPQFAKLYSAGAMTLAENSLYTVDAWQIFYRALMPDGLITFSRWYFGPEVAETYRLFSVAWATLLSEGIADPTRNIALVYSDRVATILVSKQPFSDVDLDKLQGVVDRLKFKILFSPRDPAQIPELRSVAAAHTLAELAHLRYTGDFDYSPVFDSSPYFFNAVRFRNLARLSDQALQSANLRALFFVFAFMLAAFILVALTIVSRSTAGRTDLAAQRHHSPAELRTSSPLALASCW